MATAYMVPYYAVFMMILPPDEAEAYRGGLSTYPRWTDRNSFGVSQITQQRYERDLMCQWELVRSHGLAIEWAHSRPQRPPYPQTQGDEKSPL